MADYPPQSARAVAAEVLARFDPNRAYAGPILNRLLDRTDQKQRATDLVFGTIRNLQAIDTVITRFSGRKIERIAKDLLTVIRIGVYELLYSPDTPDYSIVNEAVNAAKRMGGSKQTGFVNAVLRTVIRHIKQRRAEQTEANARRTLMTAPPNGEGCVFDSDFLPDPKTDFARYLSTSFSLPLWLIGEWSDEFGPEPAREICVGSNRRPSVYIRPNSLKTTAAALLERFRGAGLEAEFVVPPDAEGAGDRTNTTDGTHPERLQRASLLRVVGPQSVTKLPGFAEGLFTIQDPSASNAVALLDPQSGWTILDLCAAPGTKTTQLAERTQDKAQIVATDIDASRLEKVHENLTRLGVGSVTVIPYSEAAQKTPARYDAILLDVPCSNTGVLAKRVEARFRLNQSPAEELVRTQRALLEKATTLLKPGGRICYSTCSIQRAENSDLIDSFLKANRQFELVAEELLLPSATGFDHDGAYVAVLAQTP